MLGSSLVRILHSAKAVELQNRLRSNDQQLGGTLLSLELIKPILRQIKWLWQDLTRGFSDRDLWSLDHTILTFALPRLKAFRDKEKVGTPSFCYTGCKDENYPTEIEDTRASIVWDQILGTMIFYAEEFTTNGATYSKDDPKFELYEKGRANFNKYFHALWD